MKDKHTQTLAAVINPAAAISLVFVSAGYFYVSDPQTFISSQIGINDNLLRKTPQSRHTIGNSDEENSQFSTAWVFSCGREANMKMQSSKANATEDRRVLSVQTQVGNIYTPN